jgi:hypothetical protein
VALRSRYMPLFNTNHVRAVFSGHEHLFEHWVERYSDSTGPRRMDLVVSGGGGAPIYAYTGEPDISYFLKANEASKIKQGAIYSINYCTPVRFTRRKLV